MSSISPGLIVAADLSALNAAAGDLAATFSTTSDADDASDLGHAGAEDALRGFSAAARAGRQQLADHGRAGADTLRGFALAFHHAAG
ncbi:hypothetical protein [Jatrophihabitans fulvus]